MTFVHDDDEGSCNIFLDTFVSWVNKYAAAAEESSASLLGGRPGGLRHQKAVRTLDRQPYLPDVPQ